MLAENSLQIVVLTVGLSECTAEDGKQTTLSYLDAGHNCIVLPYK